ncbi:Short-chain dehydrogenase [Flexibacter flexilis DSM 6793]|uniref:Short-chain dehydrogenase n=1 Tax=Flexibacter flexilis DSM 6793 TaxID=927664 RepID=A0A1I1DU70_9BACT|nr:SDR family oxidoreductase [Flexibacter flexilis]SFB76083.1 Short-chain dehydrogenase [Flexibacter flexilis DSM 6793]
MKDKVVIITGGSSGIGKACALVFGKAGAKVVITGRRADALNEAVTELKSKGITVKGVVADVSVHADNAKVAAETLAAFGRIDVLINNAGISMRALFSDLDVSVIEKVMQINFFGTVYATKTCLPYIIANKGSIVGISSIAGYRGLPARTGYSASKAAMQAFLESLRTELLKKDVHVLVACPGFTASNIRNVALTKDGSTQGESPLDEGNIMSAEEVAFHIYNAVMGRKRDLVLTRQGKLTVFLNKWLPSLMDKLVFNHFAKEKDSPIK